MITGIKSQNNNISNGINNVNKLKSAPSYNKFNKLSKNEAYFAKKGEPIYDKEMDKDKDGIVTFDEFQDYCKETNADVEQLLKNWLVYHSLKNAEEISKKIKEEDIDNEDKNSEIVYARKGDEKYKAVMDSNNDNTITYKEYLEYCSKNSKNEKNKESNAENIEDVVKKHALEEYGSADVNVPEGKIETEV